MRCACGILMLVATAGAAPTTAAPSPSERSLARLAEAYRTGARQKAMATVALWSREDVETEVEALAALLSKLGRAGHARRLAAVALLTESALLDLTAGDFPRVRWELQSAAGLVEAAPAAIRGSDFDRRFCLLAGLALHCGGHLEPAHRLLLSSTKVVGDDAELVTALGAVIETVSALRGYDPSPDSGREPRTGGYASESGDAGALPVRLADAEWHYQKALALDVSTSVAGERLARLRAAAGSFLRGMSGRDEAALVTFNHKITVRQAPTTDRSAVADALGGAEARGSTAVIDALYGCLKRTWGSGRPLVVLFTDGRDTASWLENDDVLQAARKSSAHLYVVGTEATGLRFELSPTGAGSRPVRPDSGYMYLLQRATDTTGGAYWSATYEGLEAAFLEVLEAANARYVLRYEPEGVAREGRHSLKVSVRRKGLEVRARQEYVVSGTPEP